MIAVDTNILVYAHREESEWFSSPSECVRGLAEGVEPWAVPGMVALGEARGYWDVLQEFVLGARIAGPPVHDAHVAAACMHHGVEELWTADRDFSRFPALKVRNPLVM